MKIGVILSGCGFLDGAEIHESVLTLLAIAKNEAEAVCMAPNMEQREVINHLTQKPMNEKRNVLVEAARIARGDIRDIKDIHAEDIDALVLPGGYGAAKNLCTFAYDGPQAAVHPEVERLIREVQKAGKPLGAICIAPALVAKIFEGESVRLTIGNDKGTAQALEGMGHQHVACQVENICVDDERNLVSTPAYMLAQGILDAHIGIEKLVAEIIRLAR
jgi:enhancing lycopene biosynthesis protein 2